MKYFDEEVYRDLSKRFGGGHDANGVVLRAVWDGGSGGEVEGWKAVHIDCLLGWRRVLSTSLVYLQSMAFPTDVSGRHHRYEILVSVKYMTVLTDKRGDFCSPVRFEGIKRTIFLA
jgi:hypothetical protein